MCVPDTLKNFSYDCRFEEVTYSKSAEGVKQNDRNHAKLLK